MSRNNLIATSLISAIPAALLFYLVLMGVLGGFEKLPVMLMVMMIILLVVALGMVGFPVFLFVKSGRGAAKSKAADSNVSKTAAVPSSTEDEELDADFADTTGAQLSASELDMVDDDDAGPDAFEFDEEDDDDF